MSVRGNYGLIESDHKELRTYGQRILNYQDGQPRHDGCEIDPRVVRLTVQLMRPILRTRLALPHSDKTCFSGPIVFLCAILDIHWLPLNG
jgi:hypothetical protein